MAAIAVDPVLVRNTAKLANAWIPTTSRVKVAAVPSIEAMAIVMMTTTMQDAVTMAAIAVDPALVRNTAKLANAWIPTTSRVKAAAVLNSKAMATATMTTTMQDVIMTAAIAVDPVLVRNTAKLANA